MINFVIPMAGRGTRFTEMGYDLPKFLIEVHGKTLLEYSLESMPIKQGDGIIFVALREHDKKYDLKMIIASILGNGEFELITVPEVTRGQAETVLQARTLIDNKDDLVIYNIDTYFRSEVLRDKLENNDKKLDGVLGCMEVAPGDVKWSFAKVDDSGVVIETAEKVQISTHALTGLYHFSAGCDFVRVARRHIEADRRYKNEYYIAPMYNDLIAEGKRYVLDPVDAFVPLGTPEDLEQFRENG